MKLVFTHSALQQFKELPEEAQKRIRKKLDFYLSQENPLEFAKSLSGKQVGEWRFRVGDYRVLFDCEKGKIIVLKVGHRKEIYK